jgi:hypothetical protein
VVGYLDHKYTEVDALIADKLDDASVQNIGQHIREF